MKNRLTLLAVILFSYLYGISYLPLRGEEANRFLTAYEMAYFHDFFNPTHLGEPYFIKPPLFMDVEILFAHILGWHWWIGRIVSIVAVFLTAWLVYRMGIELFEFDRKTSTVAAIMLLTFGDLAVFYGFLGEIDAFHMFIFTLGVYLFYRYLKRNKYLLAFILAGFIAALVFLTKGFPAIYHMPVSVLVILFFENSLRLLLTPYPLLGIVSFAIPIAVWYFNLHHPHAYLKGLWSESFRRIEETDRITKTVKHLLTYPLLTFKQLLPYSFFLLLIPFSDSLKKRLSLLIPDKKVRLLAVLFFINYLPYLISPEGKGRYALIAFPFAALLLARFLSDTLTEKRIKSTFVGLIPFILFILSIVPVLLYPSFFLENNDPIQLLFLIPLLATIFYAILLTRREGLELLTFLVLITLTVKVGFANFAALQKTRANPAREIARALSLQKTISQFQETGGNAHAMKQHSEIRYLPHHIYMELCAYMDAFTQSIVLRKTNSPIVLTDKKDLPRGCKIEKENRGWVIAICNFQNSKGQPSSKTQ